jgi:hypothetical protein
MTVATTTNTAIGTGNGVTTVFPFTFGTLPTGDLVVTLIDLDGNEEVQTEITDYTVSGEGAEDGGSVNFLVAPPVDYTVLIQRILPYTQPTDYKNQGSFYPRTHERSFDRVTMQVQQLAEADGRTIKIPAHVQGVSTTLPTPVANGLWGWNEDADAPRYYTPADIGTTLAFSNFIADTFTATAGQTDFVLSEDPGVIANLDVSVDGATQQPGADYTLDATTVTFTTPMADGASVLVRYGTALPTGITAASAINYTPPSTGIAGTIKSFLDSLWTAGASTGAALIRFLQAGAGAVARTLQDKGRERVSVKDYGAVGDNVTNDTAAIAAAVTYALSVGAVLYWPEGTYSSNGNIPNFHAVKHSGPGVYRRGIYSWYITPPNDTTINHLYVSTTGSASNDGLTPSAPFNTFQLAIDSLENWAPLTKGQYQIDLAAGVYARGRFADEGMYAARPVIIAGPSVGGHPNVPTAIIREGATQAAIGILTFGTPIYVRDVKIEDYNGSTASCGIRNSGTGCAIYTENAHLEDCYYGVLGGGAGSVLNIKGGIFNDCGYLLSDPGTPTGHAIHGLFHVKFEVGTQGAGTLVNGPFIRNSAGAARVQELCTGHWDYVTVEDCGSGVRLMVNSRLNMDGASFKRTGGSAVYCTSGSYASLTDNTVFGTGADANTHDITTGADSQTDWKILDARSLSNAAELRSFNTSNPNTVVSSLSSGNTIESFILKGGAFSGSILSQIPAKKIVCKVNGTLTGATGTFKRVQFRLGAASLGFVDFGTAAGVFEAELTYRFFGTAQQVLTAFGSASGSAIQRVQLLATEDMSIDKTLALQVYVQNAADSITLNSIEWFIQGA